MEKISKYAPILLTLFFVFVISCTVSTDFSQDLGRHLKLGEIILQTTSIPQNNLFSYTHPSFPFMNHHWLTEVVLYLLVKSYGLGSLQLLKIVLVLSAMFITLRSSMAKASGLIVSGVAVVILPLFTERLDIRPELFGYLFFAFVLHVLFFQKSGKWLYVLPFVMMLWINIHISFVFGIFLIGYYLFIKGKKVSKLHLICCILAGGALFINPMGLNGVLYPFRIFSNYGYTIVENQNIFFLNSVLLNPIIRYYFLLTPIIGLGGLILLVKREFKLFGLLLIFYFLSVWQIRHLPFFVLVSIPILSTAARYLSNYVNRFRDVPYFGSIKRGLIYIQIATYFVFIFTFAMNIPYRIFDKQKVFGIEVLERQKEATDFVLKQDLPKRLFNNFDIGGYAIYRLWPKYEVFVDNRPEAYPVEFFKNTYIEMQNSPQLRRQIFDKYGIHTVFFAHTDMTPWGVSFLEEISKDTKWKMIFLNDSIVVFTDAKGHDDIREKESSLDLVLIKTTDYVSLLKLASFFFRIGRSDLGQQAFTRAQKLNPSSCTIKRAIYANGKNTPAFFSPESASQSWWCF